VSFDSLTPTEDEARQWRIARAAILLMGNSGVRRDEAANARRENLSVAVATATGSPTKSPTDSSTSSAAEQRPVWALGVIGKRRKQRTVPVNVATVAALRAHWADRELDFDAAWAEGPLIAPVVINGTDASLAKHRDASGGEGGASHRPHAPYAADALARLVRESVRRIAEGLLREGALSHDAHVKLLATSAHAFRHTLEPRRLPAVCRLMWRNGFSGTRRCRRRRSMFRPSGSACLKKRQNII